MSLPNTVLTAHPLYDSVQGVDFNLQLERVINNDKYLYSLFQDSEVRLLAAIDTFEDNLHQTDANTLEIAANNNTVDALREEVRQASIQFTTLNNAIILNTDRINQYLVAAGSQASALAISESNRASINNINDRVVDLQSDISSNDADITNLQNDMVAVESSISALNFIQNANTNYIKTAVSIQDALEKLDAQIAINENDISTETTRAQTAESLLQTNIDILASTLGTSLGDSTSQNTTLINNETARAQSAETIIEGNALAFAIALG